MGVSDFFAEKGNMIVFTKGRGPNQTQEFKASGGEKFDKRTPVVVLVNEGSASGAEIVAGCLKDLKRAVLIGTKTFGKGSVQTILPLENSDGAALRLTMAKYYTPSGICIHGIGIDPELNLKDHDISESTLKAYSKQMPQKFAKEKVKEGLEVTADMVIGDKLISEFYDYCMKNLKKIDKEEMGKDEIYLKNSLLIELVREKIGEKEARQTGVLIDPQVKVAEEIIGDGGKISKQLMARYPKKKGEKEEEAREKKLEEERGNNPPDGE